MGLSHRRVSQLAPGAAQIPQLALQHTMPELQVLGPHIALSSGRLRLFGAGGGAALGAGSAGAACDVEAATPIAGALGAGLAAVSRAGAGTGAAAAAAGAAGTACGATTAGEVATAGGTFTITTLRSVGCGAAGAETDGLC